jgi:hypothetical protein
MATVSGEAQVAATQLKNILVAVNMPVRQLVSQALQFPDWVLNFCDSVEEAKLLLRDRPCDLIFCSLQFDSSRMFDLLQYAKTNSKTESIPFVAVKILEGILSASTVENILKTARLYGASESVNLAEWRKQLGDEPAYAKLRNTIRQLLH